MNSYLVKIVYQIICGDGFHTAQFDEQMRYVTAATEEIALQKAQRIGLQEAETFFNNQQQLVQWKYVDVSEIYSLNQLNDGAEVFSQIRETDDAGSYCRFVHHKAAHLGRQQALTAQTT
ncbi:MAG TPA: DUF4288 domain-containing protein [Flavisolibacter sp.]|jgi:hypothetical protein|nr:DUF4288 domain-containing protein [Flavisolibacter sp.]